MPPSAAAGFPRRLRPPVLAGLWTCLFLVLAAAPAATAQEISAWDTLAKLRAALVEAGPTRADFEQTYVPAGFTSGETEAGRMLLSLPECMRWDYSQPYEKSFLLCGDTAHYWNPQDGAGRRYEVDREKEPGLDLLMLSVDTLRQRYRAKAVRADGAVRVTLEPVDAAGSLAEASLLVDPAAGRLRGLSYRDREGNRTTFEIGEPRPLDPAGVFQPPRGVRWQSGGD